MAFVRKLDDIGRLAIPEDIRQRFGIAADTPLEFFLGDDEIIMRVYAPGCVFCGEASASKLRRIHGMRVCTDCLLEVKGRDEET